MTTTSNLAITQVAPNQNQKETTIGNAFEKLDQATQGKLAVAFTSNAATISGTNFTSRFCFVCGVLGAAGTITVPLSNRLFMVDNRGGGYDVDVAGATGAAVTVPDGTVALLYCDGTDVMGISGGGGGGGSVTAADIAALDFSSLPTSDPGGGLLWLNGGVLQVGA